MKLTIGQTAKQAGISVRTLHYYDEIGLLHPQEKSEAGYRYYDRESLTRLQQILLYRELGFPLGEIAQMLSQPNYDPTDALRRQRRLLQLKRERLERLINHVEKILQGGHEMEFQAFDQTEIERVKEEYRRETEERFGQTEEYQESLRRSENYAPGDWAHIQKQCAEIFSAFAEKRDAPAEDGEVQELVRRWQDHITEWYYPCTKEILASLGQMYRKDERFTKTIDAYGTGTAQMMSKAIEVYCKN